MSRYYRKNNSRGYEAARQHIQEYHELEKKLGAIIGDIRKIFFSLNDDNLNKLLLRYKESYGHKAYDYAVKTYSKWKNGEVKLSGQTAKRLIELIPHFLSFNDKFNLMKKLCDHHTKKDYFTIDIDMTAPSCGVSSLNQCLTDSVHIPVIKQLPDDTFKLMTWLNSDDMNTARIILSKIDREIHEQTAKIASGEVRKIRQQISNNPELDGTQTIVLPTAEVTINYIQPKKTFFQKISSLWS